MQIGTCETFLDLCVFQNFTGSQASNLADFLMGFSEELISFPGIKIKKKKIACLYICFALLTIWKK